MPCIMFLVSFFFITKKFLTVILKRTYTLQATALHEGRIKVTTVLYAFKQRKRSDKPGDG